MDTRSHTTCEAAHDGGAGNRYACTQRAEAAHKDDLEYGVKLLLLVVIGRTHHDGQTADYRLAITLQI